MKKRILSIFMCLCMMLCLLPTAALADSITDYDIWVGGVRVTSENAGSVTGPGITGTVSYNVTNNTLTLDGASITGAYTDSNSNSAAIYASTALTIALTGVNTAIGPYMSGTCSYGVYCSGALAINGTGSLTATGGEANDVSSGVSADSISVSGGAAVTAIAGTAGRSCGTYGNSVTVAGVLTATAGSSTGISCGVFCANGDITVSGIVTATGDTAVNSCGMYCESGSIAVSGTAKVTATGGKATNSSYGVAGAVTVSGGIITATGGKATNSSYGVFGSTINVNNNGGNGLLIAKGETSAANTGATCGAGSAALTGVMEEAIGKFAVWGVSETYTVLNSTLDLSNNTTTSDWSDPANSRGWKWEYNAGGISTLTLKNVFINAPDNASGAFGIRLPESAAVNIVLEGVNVVSAGAASSGHSYGVYSYNSISISGDGAFYALASAASSGSSYGVYGYGVSVTGSATVTVIGSAASGGSTGYSYGVYGGSGGISVSDGATVTAAGGAASGSSFGVYGYGGVSVTGATVTATGGATEGTGGRCSCGVSSGSSSSSMSVMDGATVTATGGAAGGHDCSYGVCGSSISVMDGGTTVTATGGTAYSSYGVYSFNNVSVTDGIVTVTGGTATTNSYGVFSYSGSISVTGGTVTAISSSVGNYGSSQAMHPAPNLTGCTNHGVVASTSVDGTSPATSYDANNIATYKYIKIGALYALTVNLNGGSGMTADSNYVAGTAVSIDAGTKPGCTFSGWTATGGGTFASASSAATTYTMPAGAATITANWIPVYALTVNLDGGSGATTSNSYLADTVIPIDAGTKSGYAFSGWTATGGGTFASASSASTTYTMPAGAATITASWIPVYALTVNLNGGSGATTGNSYLADSVIPIDAGTKPGYTFSGWAATGGTFANASSAATNYTMPAGAATITANWTANPTGGGDGGTSTTTVPASSNSGTVKLSVSISGTTATVSTTDAQLQKIASGTEPGPVKIDASGLKVDTVVVSSKLVTTVDDASGSTGLEVSLPAGTVTLDKAALAAVSGKGNIKFSIKTVSNSALTNTQREVLGTQAKTALVVDVNVYVNGARTSTFGDGKIQVSVPYTLKSRESADSVTVWFIKDDGTIEPKNGTYNTSTGCVEFTTNHLSLYLIVRFPFTDVADNSWYYGSVAYAYNNGLFAGTSDTTFSPDTAMTREMIWMVLARMDGKTPADMDAARTWAMENGISDGSKPTDSITREQMATILYRYAQYKSYDTTQGGMTIREFTDYDRISEYALPALAWTVNAGLMQGSNNNIMPSGSATRAQVATILQQFCQNAVK